MPLSIAWLALRQKTGVRCLRVLGFFGWAVLLFLNWVYEQFFCPFELSYVHHWGVLGSSFVEVVVLDLGYF